MRVLAAPDRCACIAGGLPAGKPERCARTCWPGCDSACMRVLIVSMGNMSVCSIVPATAPATIGCSQVAHTGR